MRFPYLLAELKENINLARRIHMKGLRLFVVLIVILLALPASAFPLTLLMKQTEQGFNNLSQSG